MRILKISTLPSVKEQPWCEAVFYKGLKSGLKFCRFESDFDSSFSAVKTIKTEEFR